MNQRFLIWGLASIAFMVTLGVSSRQEGLWPSATSSDAQAPQALAEPAATAGPTEPARFPFRPFAPDKPAPAAIVIATATPEPQAQQQEQPSATPAEIPPPEMPTATAEVDTPEFLSHRDRAAQHSSRAH